MARVLIVDDVEIVRKALQVGVQKLGHEAEGASDPFDALELARLHPPDLALVDYRMPGMDGVAFFDAMKQPARATGAPRCSSCRPRPPTRSGRSSSRPGSVRAGFVRKPFHLDELWKTVKDALAS